MPKGVGYGKKRKSGLGGKRKKAITAASYTRWAERQAVARKKKRRPPVPKAPGRRKMHTKKKQKLKGRAGLVPRWKKLRKKSKRYPFQT